MRYIDDALRVDLKLSKGLEELGMPPKFTSFRPFQLEAASEAAKFDGQFLLQDAPTGIGKSFIYVVASKLRQTRTVILTSTKGLQDQLMKDFRDAGMVEVRGRSNYRCEVTGQPASFGPCRWGMRCALKSGGCTYYDAIKRANSSDMVVTNYAFWLHNESLEEPFMLVLDEAHSAFDHLVSYYTATIDKSKLMWYTDSHGGAELLDKQFVQATLAKLESRLKADVKAILENGGELKSLGPLTSLCENMRTLARALQYDCIKEENSSFAYVLPIVAPPERLFRSPFCLLTSATLSTGTAALLGLPEYKLSSYPSNFPVGNRLVHVLPGVPVDFKTSAVGDRSWAMLIDQILRSRPNDKGLIHTTSYSRRDKYRKLSKESRVLYPSPKETASMVARFKCSSAPDVLASPAVGTGYDFPEDECRFQVMAKVPFPEAESKLHRARTEVFPLYPFYYAWQQLVQAAGRGIRSADDWCDTFVVDSHIKWLHRRYPELAPQWFLGAINYTRTIPKRRIVCQD